jgi:hypothetical protein
MKRILEIFKEIKVISISEMNFEEKREQSLKLRSIFDHFYSLNRDEIFKLDSVEERIDIIK